MHEEFIPQQGLTMVGKHHEIYLSDPRRAEAAKLRTILRQPVAGSTYLGGRTSARLRRCTAMREREPKPDWSKVDRKTRRIAESLAKERKRSGRAKPDRSSEGDSAGGRMAVWADESSKKLQRSDVHVPGHELLGVSEQEYRQMKKKRPRFYWATPSEKDVSAAAKTYWRRPDGR
jgi:hypothetical protein